MIVRGGMRGGAALEYMVVTAFALVSAAAAVGLAAKAIKAKIAVVARTLGVEGAGDESGIDAFLEDDTQ